ncbi:unnamed protein product [Acanthoscelides obtectus]|uniref:Uncharacterized protein n=1 Tax=Acanthoscelides obtectus TaxID=200917 RepID=A0A9P0KFN2_ACAOB|nr:unnamed protein product [Acanthoscelides obtectus]CAK1627841.1 Immunoglobulin superfamily containing leucine-rich repeat protein 2 [Acanthoscelides obtectus]
MLTISNASVNKIDPKLKYFKHLKYLDLSNNNVQISSIPSLNSLEELKLSANSLKRVNISALPHQIKDLDLSNNLLTEVPKDIRALQSLKTLHLQKNPIDCDCMNVIMYETLLKSGVNIPEPVMCHSPKKYSGKDISTVNCTLGDVMLNDDYEGSGASDIFEDSPISNVPFVPEEEDVIVDNNTIIDDRLPEEELIKTQGPENVLGPVIEEEGSGDEGSGYIMLPDSGILGCIENCSTPGPVGTHDEASASAPPSVVDQFGMLWEDINPFKEREESTKVSSTTSHPKDFAKEPRMFKETVPTIEKNSVKDEDVEVVSNRTQAKEMERASVAPQNSNAVYAIVGIGVFLAFVFLICFIKKRKTSRNSKHKRQIPQLGEEMKPLTKPLIQAVNEKPSKNIPEHIPLINGQNGKPKNDAPLLTSFTPLAHPEFTKEGDLPQDQDHDEVEMRTKYQPELLTPQRERVTIRESEIPDSIPKTPLLVHRQKNSEGEIVTTVVP